MSYLSYPSYLIQSPATKDEPEDLPDYDEGLYGDGPDSDTRPDDSGTRLVDSDGSSGDATDDE